MNEGWFRGPHTPPSHPDSPWGRLCTVDVGVGQLHEPKCDGCTWYLACFSQGVTTQYLDSLLEVPVFISCFETSAAFSPWTVSVTHTNLPTLKYYNVLNEAKHTNQNQKNLNPFWTKSTAYSLALLRGTETCLHLLVLSDWRLSVCTGSAVQPPCWFPSTSYCSL